ncbi:MAG: DUF2157 domain-containing protein, partial [Kiritimatiellae bacterium]|nr:DUF2157 domain-containing protein [Kiritimatiellia bacterium]
ARRKIEEIDRQIAELKKRRKALSAELGAGRLSWGAIIAGGFGALMIGLGIIALFAANWSEFGRPARAAIAIAPVAICGCLAIFAHVKGWMSRAFWEPLGILWCVSVGAATCLVAQTYQVGGNVPGLILLVALLMLPVLWTTRAVVPTALWPIFAIVWGLMKVDYIGIGGSSLAVKSVVLMLLSLPFYIAFLRSRPPKAALYSAQAATGLIYSVGLPILLTTTLDFRFYRYVSATICTYWACAGLVALTGRIFALPVWGTVGAIVAAGAAFPTPFMDGGEMYLLALALAVAIITLGIRKMRLFLTNVGAVTLLWLVLAKFFTSHISFTIKGVVLIVAGLALTALNMVLIRLRKRKD